MYRYVAIDRTGTEQRATIAAENESTALRKLKRNGLWTVSLERIAEETPVTHTRKPSIWRILLASLFCDCPQFQVKPESSLSAEEWESLICGQNVSFAYVCKTGNVRRFSGKLVEIGNTGDRLSERTKQRNTDFIRIETKWAGGEWVTRSFDRPLMSQLTIGQENER